MPKSPQRRKKGYSTSKNTKKGCNTPRIGEVLMTAKDVLGNTFKYFYTGISTKDEIDVIENINTKKWTTIFVSTSKSNIQYIVKRLQIIGICGDMGVHESNHGLILFSTSKPEDLNLDMIKKAILTFNKDGKTLYEMN
tara:strand:+ start:68 stop:481 length:414 start_codon:yes stop_codon:yes gene_type:complete